MQTSVNMKALEGAAIGDRYRLVRYLDEGAFGAVFRAVQLVFGLEVRDVAIKIAKRPMTDAEARNIFGDALTMIRVACEAPDLVMREHFVAVHDAGHCSEGSPLAGHPYMVMELIRGGSLADCLRAGAFPLTRAMAYFDQLLAAMAFMHHGIADGDARPRPIAHRDLKPNNILITRRQTGPDILKVTDFGLAVPVDSLLGWVESGGTLSYLAPESFTHNICSPQSDVYALGLIFYEMLTLTNPFSEVGSHLRGTDDEQRNELRRLHLEARHMEKFALLDTHEELRRRPALRAVIRTSLAADMTARSYSNACELQDAWRQATKDIANTTSEHPWDTVRRLTGVAEQCFAVGDEARGDALLAKAMEINKDRALVPDPMMVGSTFLLAVKRLLAQGKREEAGRLAQEGHKRRDCRSTRLALACYYAEENSAVALRLEQEAQTCADPE